MFTNLFSVFCRKFFSRRGRRLARPIRNKPAIARPSFEALEDRIVPATMIFSGLEFSTDGSFTTTGHMVSSTDSVQVGLKPKAGATFMPELSLEGGVQFRNND